MGKETILVVDDDFDLRETIAMALEAEGYSVLTASNGKLAFSVLKDQPPENVSCILLDLLMPEMDGKEFLFRLREEHPEYANIPVVVATAGATQIENISIPYPVARIKKPMELDDLYSVVRNVLDESSIH